jgi:hypothetical protein
MKYIILKIVASVLILMPVLSSCGNNDRITLQYNMKKGEIYKHNMASNTDLVMTVMGQEMKINMAMYMKMTYEVKDVRNGGDYALEVKFKEMKLAPGGASMSFDSNTSDSIVTIENPGLLFRAIIDKPFEIVIDKIGKVQSITGMEKFHEYILGSFDENLPEEVKQQIITQVGGQFTEQSFKSQFEQSTGCFPDKPVKIGDKWNNKSSIRVSTNITVNLDMDTRLKSVEDSVATVSFEGTISTPEGSVQEINGISAKMNIKGSHKGTMKLNMNTGWIISSDMTHNFTGDIEVMGQKTPIYAASKIELLAE